MSGAEHFVAEYAVVATWGNVTFLGISERDLEKRPVGFIFFFQYSFRHFFLFNVKLFRYSQRNSYQVVIVTDISSNLTCVIFNYEKVEWAASTELGGNSVTGLSTTKAAKVFFCLYLAFKERKKKNMFSC